MVYDCAVFAVFKKLLQGAIIRNLGVDDLVDKLNKIVLSSAPLEEIPPKVNELYELWRRIAQGTLDSTVLEAEGEAIMQRLADVSMSDMRIMWEPLTDGYGEPIRPSGWSVQATMYLLNGQPWWMVEAKRDPESPPTPADDGALDKIVDRLGADAKRDRIHDMPYPELGWMRIFTWFHAGPLMEMHRNEKTNDFYIAVEGAMPKPGYKREPRLTWKHIEQMRAQKQKFV